VAVAALAVSVLTGTAAGAARAAEGVDGRPVDGELVVRAGVSGPALAGVGPERRPYPGDTVWCPDEGPKHG
jgi:hypothetical protein